MEQNEHSVISELRDLIPRTCQHIENYQQMRQKSGADFNIFRILKRSTDEEHGHSAFIGELLNPHGSHALGSIFLDLFFAQLGIQESLRGSYGWEVKTEVGRDVDGRIDILLEGQDVSGRKIAIAIENKIYAADQHQQLTRYWTHLSSNFRPNREDLGGAGTPFLLFYLTLYGYQPSNQSCEGIPKEDLQWMVPEENRGLACPVRLLSYSGDILNWLHVCHEKVARYPHVRETLSQYIDTVNSLTGNGGGMTDQLMAILDTPAKLIAAAKLSKVVKAIKPKLTQDIWAKIFQKWKIRANMTGGVLVGELQPNQYAGGDISLKRVTMKHFSMKRNAPQAFGFAALSYKIGEVPVALEFRFNRRFYVGLYGVVGEGKVFDQDVVKAFYSKVQLPQGCYPGVDFKPKDLKERIYVTTPIFFDSDNDALFSLVDEEKQNELVDNLFKIAEEIVREMGKYGLKPLSSVANPHLDFEYQEMSR